MLKPIHDYLDYREALRDYYESRKAAMPLFSYRMLGNRLGMDASQAFRVLKGELQLTEKAIAPCAELLGLAGRDAEYFELLVRFARASSDKERKLLFERILDQRGTQDHLLETRQYRFFSEWHVAAVRAMLGVAKFGEDWARLAGCITPGITAEQAQEDVELLEGLGLVAKDAEGHWTLTEEHVTTGRTVSSLAVRTFHHEMLRLGDEALERHPKDQREIGTMAMALDEACYRDVTDMLAECRRQIRNRVAEVKTPDRVVELNMQVFPLAYAPKETK